MGVWITWIDWSPAYQDDPPAFAASLPWAHRTWPTSLYRWSSHCSDASALAQPGMSSQTLSRRSPSSAARSGWRRKGQIAARSCRSRRFLGSSWRIGCISGSFFYSQTCLFRSHFFVCPCSSETTRTGACPFPLWSPGLSIGQPWAGAWLSRRSPRSSGQPSCLHYQGQRSRWKHTNQTGCCWASWIWWRQIPRISAEVRLRSNPEVWI